MDANNLMRCDKINSENIDDYQTLLKENKDIRQVVLNGVLDYINKLETSSSINTSKSYLYSSPDENSITKAYLVAGDKVKVIQFSQNNKWVKVGYVSPKGKPLVKWVKSEDIKQF